MDKPTFLPRRAKTIIPGIPVRQRHVYDICKLSKPDERGVCYHGFVNHKWLDEMIFTVVGATSLESGIWYDINAFELRLLISQYEQGDR